MTEFSFDDLRIMATSERRLDSAERQLLLAIADDGEKTQKMLVSTQVKLIEAQAKHIAVNDRLIFLTRQAAKPWNWAASWSVKLTEGKK